MAVVTPSWQLPGCTLNRLDEESEGCTNMDEGDGAHGLAKVMNALKSSPKRQVDKKRCRHMLDSAFSFMSRPSLPQFKTWT